MSTQEPISRSNRALFLASFFTLIAAGIGFAIRGAILDDWGAAFGFDKGRLGGITGGGLVGFGITIIACSLFADFIGYKPLMILAFLLHIGSAVVTFAATPLFKSSGPDAAYNCLYWGAFMFALANGVCESVINPLVATLFPKQKTHYLNILHAGWPGGLILGGILSLLFVGKDAYLARVPWEVAVAFFLPPTLYYGWVILKEQFPQSETKAAGVSLGTMLAEFASPILLFLFVLHAMVGYVELGTDGWIQNIMNASIGKAATWLFIWTSGIMFALRFFAGPIVEKINPLGLLLLSAILAFIGLRMLGSDISGFAVLLAGTIYGIGKTFFWPTMLGVVGERFPKGGALTMGVIGGIGMLSAGLLGGPGIGYKQNYYLANEFAKSEPAVYEEYRSAKPEAFLPGLPPVAGFDGAKLDEVRGKKPETLTETEQKVLKANMEGGRYALRQTAWVPAMMGVGYLLLVLYYRARGGYKVEDLSAQPGGRGH